MTPQDCIGMGRWGDGMFLRRKMRSSHLSGAQEQREFWVGTDEQSPGRKETKLSELEEQEVS